MTAHKPSADPRAGEAMFVISKGERRTVLLLLAEFFIVVVSVLVAIWLENVRQRSQDRALEQQYLEELEEDLQMDLQEVDNTRKTARARLEAAEDLMRAGNCSFTPSRGTSRGDDDARLFDAGQEIETVLEIHVIDGAQAAIQELQGSGNFRVMQNRDLVRDLHNYYSDWDRKVEGEHGQLRPDLVHLRRALSTAGVAANHGKSLEELGAIIAASDVLKAELRQAHYQAARQITRLTKLERNVRKTLASVQSEAR